MSGLRKLTSTPFILHFVMSGWTYFWHLWRCQFLSAFLSFLNNNSQIAHFLLSLFYILPGIYLASHGEYSITALIQTHDYTIDICLFLQLFRGLCMLPHALSAENLQYDIWLIMFATLGQQTRVAEITVTHRQTNENVHLVCKKSSQC